MSHPFKGTPQYEQIYGNSYGKPLGRPGNGLGDVWGGSGKIDEDDGDFLLHRRPRPSDGFPADPFVVYDIEEEEDDGISYIDADLMLALESLTRKQHFVLELRYGLKDGNSYTLEEIGELMGITNQAVSLLEQAGLSALVRIFVCLSPKPWKSQ